MYIYIIHIYNIYIYIYIYIYEIGIEQRIIDRGNAIIRLVCWSD